jgi:hypothetical protein
VTDKTSTPGSGAGVGSGPAAGPPQLDLAGVFEEMLSYGQTVLSRVTKRYETDGPSVQAQGYDADQFVRDVEWFWENVKQDAVSAAKWWAEKFPGGPAPAAPGAASPSPSPSTPSSPSPSTPSSPSTPPTPPATPPMAE